VAKDRSTPIRAHSPSCTKRRDERGAPAHDPHPKGADLILNKVSGAPGFDNVIVMAGVPSIMQAMVDEVAAKLKSGVRMLSETVRADAREGDIGMQRREIIRSTGATRMWCYAPAMHRSSRRPNARSRTCWSECGEHRGQKPHFIDRYRRDYCTSRGHHQSHSHGWSRA